MNRRSRLFAGASTAAALLLGGCSVEGAAFGLGADSAASVAGASLTSAGVAELDYSDLGIEEADTAFDAADAVEVLLADGGSSGGDGVAVSGDVVTITESGTYRVQGTLTSGSLVIDADGVVNLVLDGVGITAADVAALHVVEAEAVVVRLADGTENVLADTPGAAADETADDLVNATLFSTSDLWITGEGALRVTAHAADGITSKDSLVITGGDLTVTADDDGVRGKDHLVITGGTLAADVGGDALRSDNDAVTEDQDETVGVIWVEGGTLDLTAGADAIDAVRQVTVAGGELTIAATDDGIHSDNVLRIGGGRIDITESYEGIEGAYVSLSGGDVTVAAADDGINVAGGVEELAETTATEGEVGPGMPGRGGGPMGEAGTGGRFTSTPAVTDLSSLTVYAMVGSGFGGPAEGRNGDRFLAVSSGTYVIDTWSDGVDVNGSMTMTGGTLVVTGTDDPRNGALDVDDEFTISGGTLAANGTSAMAVAPGDGSSQATLAMTFGATVPAGTLVTITDGDGNQVAAFTTVKDSQSFVYSADELVAGADYAISVGGSVSGHSLGSLVLDGVTSGDMTIGYVAAG